MKVALIIEAAGSPHSMASTAFAGALMDGFRNTGTDAKVFGLARDEAYWLPDALGDCPSAAPWLSPPAPRLADRYAAMRMGVFDDCSCGDSTDPIATPDWYLELLLQKEMEAFAGGHGDGIVMVYPRSCAWFTVASRIAGRMGWRILAFSTEALTDVQIDARTRTDYIHRVSTCSDAIWAVSTHLAEFWREHGVPNERVITIPPMVRAGNFADIQVVPKRQSAVYIGSLAHREIDYLLDIAAMIRSQLPSFSLTIYGDAPEARRQALRSEIAAKDLTATVSVESAVAPTMVPHILKHAQVLLLPRARGEFSTAGFPNKLGEYLASGRPVVVTGVGDIPHYLTHGKDAFIVRPDDCRAFADETVRVLVGPELSDQVGACGRRFAEQHLRADLVASRILEFVQSVPRNERCRPLPTRQWVSLSRLLQASIDVESGKRAVVRVLRALRLKPPAPSSGRG